MANWYSGYNNHIKAFRRGFNDGKNGKAAVRSRHHNEDRLSPAWEYYRGYIAGLYETVHKMYRR